MIFAIFAVFSFFVFIFSLSYVNIYGSVTYAVCAILNTALYIMNNNVKELRTEVEQLKKQCHSHNQDTKKDKE